MHPNGFEEEQEGGKRGVAQLLRSKEPGLLPGLSRFLFYSWSSKLDFPTARDVSFIQSPQPYDIDKKGSFLSKLRSPLLHP